MPEGVGYGQGLDPFGQFLTQAYLAGAVPGSQTSSFNTVLDLLSPGAIQGRREAGTPDVRAQFENMFGGTQLLPEETQQMQAQTAGLQLSPEAQAQFRAKLAEAQAPLAVQQFKSFGEMLKQGQQQEFDRPRQEAQTKQFEALAKQAEAQAELFGAQAGTEGVRRDKLSAEAEESRVNTQMQQTQSNLESLAAFGIPVGAPEGTEADPQLQQMARRLMLTKNLPGILPGIASLTKSGQHETAAAIMNEIVPGGFTTEDYMGFWTRMTPTKKPISPLPSPGGTETPAAGGSSTTLSQTVTPRTPGGAGALAVPTPTPPQEPAQPALPDVYQPDLYDYDDPQTKEMMDRWFLMLQEQMQGQPSFGQQY
jgi:hypothetical protein